MYASSKGSSTDTFCLSTVCRICWLSLSECSMKGKSPPHSYTSAKPSSSKRKGPENVHWIHIPRKVQSWSGNLPFSFNSIYVPPSSMRLPCSITKWRSCNRRLSSQPGRLQSCSPKPRVSPAGCSTGNVSVVHDNLQNGDTSQRQPEGHEPCWNPGELLAVPPQLPHTVFHCAALSETAFALRSSLLRYLCCNPQEMRASSPMILSNGEYLKMERALTSKDKPQARKQTQFSSAGWRCPGKRWEPYLWLCSLPYPMLLSQGRRTGDTPRKNLQLKWDYRALWPRVMEIQQEHVPVVLSTESVCRNSPGWNKDLLRSAHIQQTDVWLCSWFCQLQFSFLDPGASRHLKDDGGLPGRERLCVTTRGMNAFVSTLADVERRILN